MAVIRRTNICAGGSRTDGAIPLFLIFSCFCAAAAAAVTDTLAQNQLLRDWEQLISANGTFRLGFFSPGSSSNRYLGISYYQAQNLTVVWVANRRIPITDSSGSLTISSDGSLEIIHSGQSSPIMLSSNATATKGSNLTATLLDSGNFVFRELDSNGTVLQVLWQSFDYPTDTLLPGMKLGFNSDTGLNWSLTSWLSTDDPSPGAFSLGGDPTGTTQLMAWRRGNVYWKSGIWNNQSFENVPDLTSDDVRYNYSYISNENETYFTYSLKNSSSPPSLWVLIWLGGFDQYKFYESDDKYLSLRIQCPPHNSSGDKAKLMGCVNQTVVECRSGDDFDRKRGYVSGTPYRYVENTSMGLIDCDELCWNNCSCVAYGTLYDNATGCRLWTTDAGFREDNNSPGDIYILRSFFDQITARINRKKKWWIWITIAVVAGATILVLGLLYCLRMRLKSKEKEESQEMSLLKLGTKLSPSEELLNSNYLENDGTNDHELKIFSLASIRVATDDFSLANKLGQGGFGPVYKGKLPEGQEIAVKRLSRLSGQGVEEFKNELGLIAKLQHTNLVRLLGCCIEGEEKMLIYEYMPNKSLDSFLFDPTKRELLDWNKRYHIIEGIAQGLLYLHKYSRLRVIHRDLKASNILLDDELNPKISDFGMARIFGRNESEANTNRVVGTYGYMSPEYAMEGIFSVKSDVYSFGVLLIEIVSGRKNTVYYDFDPPLTLLAYAWELWKAGRGEELIDPKLGPSYPIDEVLRCIHVSLLCVQECAVDRPTMSDVVSMLSNETIHPPEPKQPARLTGRAAIEVDSHRGGSESCCSINEASISVIQGR
ncbi:PREDICTED: G-type lectin S-receptor-like serine/threonine-protein kinase CES101 isoform X2 [Nelumbo nucifera]|uniref:Receptor-like serine/threonine-protein kinase n=2 Tax=Nelumbo nucifera TaxID=4432 RepID=A0A822Y3V0_NELNU|nr:PREDICTED: G-type lectin S-receptor-like serine/threonine-protein kinase CES101 isoform X2 [Nelumbo nucifera]DAD26942.1 TPA_asm: hypothetical protein HUJ06_028410 [Nelumbo nucifera]